MLVGGKVGGELFGLTSISLILYNKFQYSGWLQNDTAFVRAENLSWHIVQVGNNCERKEK